VKNFVCDRGLTAALPLGHITS